MLNPYAPYLANRNPFEVIAATPQQITILAASLGPEGIERVPAPGKWSAREIICHLADTEIAFSFRLRQALAEEHHVIQPFDQDSWAKTYRIFDGAAALQVFAALRRWNVILVQSLSPQELSKRVSHPERGEMTFQVLVETMAGHDINHIGQLQALASQFKTGTLN